MIYFRIIILSLSVIIIPFSSRSQSSIKASVDKNRILLGETFHFNLEAFVENSGAKLNIPDTLFHFEFVGTPIIDSVPEDKGVRIKATYELTSFDSGRWSLPAISLSRDVKSDSIPIDVVFSEFDPQQPYHDIKDIIETKAAKKKFPWWWLAAGAILVGAVIYYLANRKKPVIPAAKSSFNPYQEAVQQLDILRKQGLPPMQFHSRAVDIFRIYVFKARRIHSLQKTTADLVVQIKDLEINREAYEKLAQALRLSDFVKFAKYEPGSEENQFVWQMIRQGIEEIEHKQKSPAASA
jgi:hypothetical protein